MGADLVVHQTLDAGLAEVEVIGSVLDDEREVTTVRLVQPGHWSTPHQLRAETDHVHESRV